MLTAGLRLVHSGELHAHDAAQGDVDPAGRIARPARRHAAAGRAGRRDRDRSRRALGARSAPSSSRNARTRRSTRRGCRAAWCAPSLPAAPSTNTCEAARPRVSIGRIVKYRKNTGHVRSTSLGRDLDRRAAPPIVALSQLGFVWPTRPPSAKRSRKQKTRRGLPPGHRRILLDAVFLIRDSVTRAKPFLACAPCARARLLPRPAGTHACVRAPRRPSPELL